MAPILIRPSRGVTANIVGPGPWLQLATPGTVRARWGGDLPEGIARSVVPASISAYLVALEHFGTLPFSIVAAPARELAAGGFAVYPALHAALSAERDKLARWPTSRRVFLSHDRAPRVEETLRQSDLAHLLDLLGDAEREAASRGRETALRAAHDRFYRGDIATIIADFVQAEGGLLDRDDMAQFRAPVVDPVRVSFRGEYEVFDPTNPDAIHRRVEALKLALADRKAYDGEAGRMLGF